MNKVLIVGRLGSDPKFHSFDNGSQSAQFSVATTEYWTDRSTGEKCEETEWHNIVANGSIAERAQRLKKGSLVSIEGRNRTRAYTDRNGIERKVTQVLISKLENLDGRANDDSKDSSHPAPTNNGYRNAKDGESAQGASSSQKRNTRSAQSDDSDQIPF